MKTILDTIQESKLTIQATCNGHKTCGKCKIQIEKDYPITLTEKKIIV